MSVALEGERLAAMPAPFWRRCAALVYDAVLVIGLLFVAGWVVLIPGGGRAPPPGTGWVQAWYLGVVYLYVVWCWTHGGQTLGMKTFRLAAVGEAGGWLGWPRASLRFALAGPCLASGLIGLFWALFDGEGRTLHERLSRTRTVLLG